MAARSNNSKELELGFHSRGLAFDLAGNTNTGSATSFALFARLFAKINFFTVFQPLRAKISTHSSDSDSTLA
jgi:hypothetical protein